MEIVRWKDFFGTEHVLIEGKNDDIFFTIPEQKDEDGNSFVRIISKQALLEMAKVINEQF